MFYYVRGELVLAEPGTAVIDCGGVGYKLSISDAAYIRENTKIGMKSAVQTE